MIAAGYMYKNVIQKPDWINSDKVADIYSVSGCLSKDFADYTDYWKHNGYWFFNDAETMQELAEENGVPLGDSILFFYRVYEKQWDDDRCEWTDFAPEESFVTRVAEPARSSLEGYDIVSFSAGTSAECSPFSCNNLAAETDVNSHCLLRTFDEAKKLLESGRICNCEPGPYRIFEVRSVAEA